MAATVYTWGHEDPRRKIGGARYAADILPPSAYDRNMLHAAKGARRRATGVAPGSGSRLHRGISADWGRATPSASAVEGSAKEIPPEAYDRNLLRRPSQAGPYVGLRPRDRESALAYLRSGLSDGLGGGTVAPEAADLPARPSLTELAETAATLAESVADQRTRNRLNEIRQVATALAVKLRMAGPKAIEEADERRWQELNDQLSTIAGGLVPDAAPTTGAASEAVRQAVAGAPPRPVAATRADIAFSTRQLAAAIQSGPSQGTRSQGVVYDPKDEATVLSNFQKFVAEQEKLSQTALGYKTKDKLAAAYRLAGNSYSATSKVSRWDMLKGILSYGETGLPALEELSLALRRDFLKQRDL